MADGRFLGQAQRRRIGAPANSADDAMLPPAYGPGDQVKASGRYGVQTVESVQANAYPPRPSAHHDGHMYYVRGGKGGRLTAHFSNELRAHITDEGQS